MRARVRFSEIWPPENTDRKLKTRRSDATSVFPWPRQFNVNQLKVRAIYLYPPRSVPPSRRGGGGGGATFSGQRVFRESEKVGAARPVVALARLAFGPSQRAGTTRGALKYGKTDSETTDPQATVQRARGFDLLEFACRVRLGVPPLSARQLRALAAAAYCVSLATHFRDKRANCGARGR